MEVLSFTRMPLGLYRSSKLTSSVLIKAMSRQWRNLLIKCTSYLPSSKATTYKDFFGT
ncbi:hypothetical protein HanIR_Chr09g0449171 [Helianthus annuus]|nr:hypothetical protein HanIR_Chr09g0449171 [Helianthus annuus]